jgi:hypothetical protein
MNGTVASQGNFRYHGPIDLSRATATFHQLFVEAGPGGTGELIKMMNAANFLPITLALRDGDVDEAVFITDSRFRPQMRFQVENTDGVFEFKLRLDRGLARVQPRLCTLDATGRKQFIADGINPPVDITIAVPWQCVLGRLPDAHALTGLPSILRSTTASRGNSPRAP